MVLNSNVSLHSQNRNAGVLRHHLTIGRILWIRRDSAPNSQQSGIGTLVECQEPRWGTNIAKKSTKEPTEPGKNDAKTPEKPQEPRWMVKPTKPQRMDKPRRKGSYPELKPGAKHYG